MDLADIKQHKAKAEQEIYKALSTLERYTGLSTAEVKLGSVESGYDYGKKRLTSVKIVLDIG